MIADYIPTEAQTKAVEQYYTEMKVLCRVILSREADAKKAAHEHLTRPATVKKLTKKEIAELRSWGSK